MIVDPPASELDAIKQARESNEASETVVPTTFVDDAELVWRLTAKHTQAEAAKAMGGWSREAVKNYASLQKIDGDAWKIIGTAFQNIVPDEESDGVPSNGTGVPSPFSENLLRNILDLCSGQQLGQARSKAPKTPRRKPTTRPARARRCVGMAWNSENAQMTLFVADASGHWYAAVMQQTASRRGLFLKSFRRSSLRDAKLQRKKGQVLVDDLPD